MKLTEQINVTRTITLNSSGGST